MPTNLDERWCNECRQMTGHVYQAINHLLHLVLTILTSGLWLVVWICLIATQSRHLAVCLRCGTIHSPRQRRLDEL